MSSRKRIIIFNGIVKTKFERDKVIDLSTRLKEFCKGFPNLSLVYTETPCKVDNTDSLGILEGCESNLMEFLEFYRNKWDSEKVAKGISSFLESRIRLELVIDFGEEEVDLSYVAALAQKV